MANVVSPVPEEPNEGWLGPAVRAGLQVAGGAIPYVGGIVSAAAGAWGEHGQKKMNDFFKHWIQMLRDEMEEKEKTIAEIGVRLDLQDEQIAERVKSSEYQSLLKKAFREWAGTESEKKRIMVRNILTNAAQPTRFVNDDVMNIFLQWVKDYSELHIAVIQAVYNETGGITRAAIWENTGRPVPRENSAEADLFKMIIRDLSMGEIIRLWRDTDGDGRFLKKARQPVVRGQAPRTLKSAFDDKEPYFLTELGQQFVHFVMTELPPKLDYAPGASSSAEPPASGGLTEALNPLGQG